MLLEMIRGPKKYLLGLFVLAILLLQVSIGAQTGKLNGRITDKKDEPLPGANVIFTNKIVDGQKLSLKSKPGSASGSDGYYVIPAIPQGQYIIKVSYIGYRTIQDTVQIYPDQTTNLDITMQHTSVKAKDVVVTAQAQSQTAAINQQLAADNIKNIVSADRLLENPDANAAEAIGRLPGISIIRSGGEAQDFMIRGLDPKYNKVQLNGVELPSNKGAARSASVSGISQFALQGVEVSKSVTPDMEADAVSGVVNMEMKEAPKDFNASLLVKPGYNSQNDYWKEYTINGNLNNRFFNNKFGVNINLTASNTNQSTQNMSASYLNVSQTAEQLYLTFTNLNDVNSINNKYSGSLVMDYRFSSDSKIKFSGFYSRNSDDRTSVAKSFVTQAQDLSVRYYINDNKGNYYNELRSFKFGGQHFLNNLEIDYGLSYSKSDVNQPDNRMWEIWNMEGMPDSTRSFDIRKRHPSDIISYANDDTSRSTMRDFTLQKMFYSEYAMEEEHFNSELNLKHPFRLGNLVSGFIKLGGKYKNKNRFQDSNRYGGWMEHSIRPRFCELMDETFDWVVPRNPSDRISSVSMVNFYDHTIGEFIQGGFNYGWYPDIDKFNKMFDHWMEVSREKIAAHDSSSDILGTYGMSMRRNESVQSDQNLDEDYWAGYFMTEINYRNWFTLTSGFRYEEVVGHLNGKEVGQVAHATLDLNAKDTTDTRRNDFLLPMINLKLQPIKWGQILFAYTQTLHRPNFAAITPNIYYNNTTPPWTYSSGNPKLRPELWTNFDLRFTISESRIGLLSINGFYKTVEDKIWHRKWTRQRGEEPVPHFPEDAQVDVYSWLNQEYDVYVRGFETEWQTSFWYLPEPIRYFTLNLNYTFTDNETKYPHAVWDTVGTTPRGVPILKDTVEVWSGPMLNQPRHIANASIGFNYKGFNSWLSFQYKGKILRSKRELAVMDVFKNKYFRVDLRVRQKLPVKGLDLLFSISNLNNFREKTKHRGDWRPVSMESYGWTADFGIRYDF